MPQKIVGVILFDAVHSLKTSDFCLFVSSLVFQGPDHTLQADALNSWKGPRCCCNAVTSRGSEIFSPNGLHERSVLSPAVKSPRGEKVFRPKRNRQAQTRDKNQNKNDSLGLHQRGNNGCMGRKILSQNLVAPGWWVDSSAGLQWQINALL